MKTVTRFRRELADGAGSPTDAVGDNFDGSGTIFDAAHLEFGPDAAAADAPEAATGTQRSTDCEATRSTPEDPAHMPAASCFEASRAVTSGIPSAMPFGDSQFEPTGSLVVTGDAARRELDMPMATMLADFPASDSLSGAAAEPPSFVVPGMAAAAIEQNSLPMVVWDTGGRIVAINAAFSRLTGYTAADFGRWNLCLLASGRHDSGFFTALWDEVAASGRWLGELWIRARDGREFVCLLALSALREAGAVRHHAAVFADLTAAREAHDESLRSAHEDPLTGLASQSLLADRLRHAISAARRSGEGLALLFADLDGFKHVNDSFGRSAGDEVLRLTGLRLRGCVREQDTAARLGSDEFVLLLPGVASGTQAMAAVRKIGVELFRPMVLGGREHKVTASVGISLFPDDGIDAQTLMQHAETAMFGAKARGRNSYAFYRRHMTEEVRNRLLMEANLAQALDRNELSVVFQPQIDVATGVVTGAETLLRWEHPELGTVAPDRFIPLAEESGLIRPIGAWVLRSVCAQLKAWRDEGLGPLRLAVNVSPRQIARRKHTDQLIAILSGCWEPGGGMEIEIEITESSLQTSQESMEAAGLFKSAGATLAIDDFGTGYSSLTTLRELPVDRLKLDRSFIDGPTGDAGKARLAAAAIVMGRTLGLRVLAEGVEDDAQLAFLRRHRCDEAQGFLIGHPMSAHEFRQLVLRSRTGH